MFYGKYAHIFRRSAYVNEKPKINCCRSELVLSYILCCKATWDYFSELMYWSWRKSEFSKGLWFIWWFFPSNCSVVFKKMLIILLTWRRGGCFPYRQGRSLRRKICILLHVKPIHLPLPGTATKFFQVEHRGEKNKIIVLFWAR